MNTVIKAVVVVLLIGILGPIAIGQIFGATTTDWSAQGQTLWLTMGLVAIVAFLLLLLGVAVKSWMGKSNS